MNAETVCGVGILCAVSGCLLRSYGWRGVPLVGIMAWLVILGTGVPLMREGVSEAETLAKTFGAQTVWKTALRTVGIGYLCTLTADLCRELGEAGAAKAVTVGGMIAVFGEVFPSVRRLLSQITELLQ